MIHEAAIRDLESLIHTLEIQRREYPLLGGSPEEKAFQFCESDRLHAEIMKLRHSVEFLRQDAAANRTQETAHV